MSARVAHEPSRRICLQPALVLAPVPDPVLRPEHPSKPFAVEHREVADREPERSRLQIARTPLVDQCAVACLSFRERVHSHGLESISPHERVLGPV